MQTGDFFDKISLQINTVTFRQYNIFNTVTVSYNNGKNKIKIENKVKTCF